MLMVPAVGLAHHGPYPDLRTVRQCADDIAHGLCERAWGAAGSTAILNKANTNNIMWIVSNATKKTPSKENHQHNNQQFNKTLILSCALVFAVAKLCGGPFARSNMFPPHGTPDIQARNLDVLSFFRPRVSFFG